MTSGQRTKSALQAVATAFALYVATAYPSAASAQTAQRPANAPSALSRTVASAADASAEIVLRALSLLGVRYRYGGNTPETGLDCSGFVKLVFQETVGLALPRRSDDMSRFGQSVAWSDLQPGDLVFFNTMRFAFSHVGIYIGEGQFVHAPSSGSVVRVEALNKDYWVRRFDGARRLVDAPPDLAAFVPGRTVTFEAIPSVSPSDARSSDESSRPTP